jgi:hypothetical protein
MNKNFSRAPEAVFRLAREGGRAAPEAFAGLSKSSRVL